MKGLLFTPEMAAAACQGRKSQTRRVMSPQPSETHETADRRSYRMDPRLQLFDGITVASFPYTMGELEDIPCDYRVGERRCLLTTWACNPVFDASKPTYVGETYDQHRAVRADFKFWHAGMGTPKPDDHGKLRPGRFLPNTLRHLMPVFEIVSLRAERVNDISNADAIKEGVADTEKSTALMSFARLWDVINQARGYGWTVNPWVWVIEFRRTSP